MERKSVSQVYFSWRPYFIFPSTFRDLPGRAADFPTMWCCHHTLFLDLMCLINRKVHFGLIRPKKPSCSWPWESPTCFGWRCSFSLSLCSNTVTLTGEEPTVVFISAAEVFYSFRVVTDVSVASFTTLFLHLWPALSTFTHSIFLFLLVIIFVSSPDFYFSAIFFSVFLGEFFYLYGVIVSGILMNESLDHQHNPVFILQ